MRFTQKQIDYLSSLEAVAEVNEIQITYADWFKEEVIRRYINGISPTQTFREYGLGPEIIGPKRIEKALYRWKQGLEVTWQITQRSSLARHPRLYQRKVPPHKPLPRYDSYVGFLEAEILWQEDRRKQIIERWEQKLSKQKLRSEAEKEKLIAALEKENNELRSQVKALKANGTFAKKTKRAPNATVKTERFELIFQLSNIESNFNIKAACKALEVSRSGYYKWLNSFEIRRLREDKDAADFEYISEAYSSHGAKKGSRLVRDTLQREYNITMNRKKIVRLMRKYGLSYCAKRKNPYYKIGPDGEPKVAPNILDRKFHPGYARQVFETDITYMHCKTGFAYLSAVIDAQTNEVVAYEMSTSLKMPFVISTLEQLRSLSITPGALIHSDQGVHYTSQSYRAKVHELGLIQSMSKRACCWDNACIESFFGRMKEQIGKTKSLSFAELKDKVDGYIHYYNNYRGQVRLGGLSPKEYAGKLAA